MNELPLAQRGSFAVGVDTLQLSDPSRGRTLVTEVWYPSSEKDAPTVYDALIGVTKAQLKGQAKRRGRPAKGPFPLIVASHGQPGTRYQFAHLSEHLASYGFVVANLDHPGSTYPTLTQENYLTSIADRPLDLLFALGELGKRLPYVDGQRAGLMGYSYGGYSVINAAGAGLDGGALAEYCKRSGGEGPCFAQGYFARLEALRGPNIQADPRIKAVFAMAPYGQPWIGAKSLAQLRVPLMIAVGEDDNIATYKRDGLEYFSRAGSPEKYLLTLEKARHNPFVECPPEVQSNPTDLDRCYEPVWDRALAHAVTQHYATAFFVRFLQGQTNPYLSPAQTPKLSPNIRLQAQP